MPATARAQIIDPSTLHVFNGTDPGTDPNPIGSSGALTITQQSNGNSPAGLNPVLLIIGIANDPSTNGNSFYTALGNNAITSVTYSSGGTASWQLGGSDTPFSGGPTGTWNTSTGFGGTMPTTNNEAYATLGIGQGVNNSNSFGNWQGGEVKFGTGVTANSFSLYVFTLTDTALLNDGDSISVQFAAGALPVGSYAIAYSFSGGKPYVTPFTEAGLETPGPPPSATPAPASAILAGLGGLGAGVGGMVRRFRRTRLVAA
jgi:hypothetical protein